LADVGSGAPVDRHLADQRVLFAALAHGSSHWVSQITDHVLSTVWMVRSVSAMVGVADKAINIEGTSRWSRTSGPSDTLP
jgi:RNA 3'-terminal phosphate cyclase